MIELTVIFYKLEVVQLFSASHTPLNATVQRPEDSLKKWICYDCGNICPHNNNHSACTHTLCPSGTQRIKGSRAIAAKTFPTAPGMDAFPSHLKQGLGPVLRALGVAQQSLLYIRPEAPDRVLEISKVTHAVLQALRLNFEPAGDDAVLIRLDDEPDMLVRLGNYLLFGTCVANHASKAIYLKLETVDVLDSLDGLVRVDAAKNRFELEPHVYEIS